MSVQEDGARLIARIARGEDAEEALAALYDAHSERLYSLSLHICGQPSMAEDAVQDTFVAVWRSASRYASERGRVATWLYAIVRSRTLDLVRAEKRRPTPAWMSESLIESLTYREGTAMRESVEQKVLADELHDTVSRLPTIYRQVVELSYFGGYTHREIAHLLQIPLGTVKSRIRIGLERLAGWIEKEVERHERGTAM